MAGAALQLLYFFRKNNLIFNMSKGFIWLLGNWVGGYAELWDLYKSDNEHKVSFLYQNNQPTDKSLKLVQGCFYSGLLVLGLGYLLYLFYTTPNLEQTSFMILVLTFLYMALMFVIGFFAFFVLIFLGMSLGQWLAKNKSVGLKSYWALSFLANGLYWAAIVLLIRLILPDVLSLDWWLLGLLAPQLICCALWSGLYIWALSAQSSVSAGHSLDQHLLDGDEDL